MIGVYFELAYFQKFWAESAGIPAPIRARPESAEEARRRPTRSFSVTTRKAPAGKVKDRSGRDHGNTVTWFR